MSILYLTQMEYEHLHSECVIAHYPIMHKGKYRCIEIHPADQLMVRALARLLIQMYEKKSLRKLLMKKYFFSEEQELQAILKYAQYLLNHGDIMEEVDVKEIDEDRLNQISSELRSYMTDSKLVHLEGFFRFRLKKIWMGYSKIIESAIDEYMMEKEYRDYVNYLRGLVNNRMIQISFIHMVLQEENQYVFLDAHGETIDFTQFPPQLGSDTEHDIIYDDQIISRLITINPNKILYHNSGNKPHVAQSIHTIFEDRFTECAGCELCTGGFDIAKNT